MIFDLHNPTPSLRIFFDAAKAQHFLHPRKDLTGIELTELEAERLRASGMRVVGYDADPDVVRPSATRSGKPAVYIDGMWGIGDNLHQRAPIRELMKDNEVWLSTCHWQLYHDLIAKGLHLVFKSTRLRAQSKTIERERHLFTKPPIEPANTRRIKLWYKKPQIDQYGSILSTMMAECGLPGKKGDFSLPIPDEWRARAEALKASWNIPINEGLMLYRPIVRRREWNGESRNPDPVAYAALYEAARPGYFTVSIADLEPKEEWIVGEEQAADVKLHSGELDFETMAALFSIADMGFFNAGFAPVLAQAVGLKSIVVYGGRESFRTTQAAGVHLAPTLGIDPINPCDCHTERHGCDKRIDLPPALDKVREFTDKYLAAKRSDQVDRPPTIFPSPNQGIAAPTSDTLIFATTYVDSEARQALTEQWLELTHALNPGCPLLLVDSKSPLPLVGEVWKKQHPDITYRVHDFGNNIGHLSRNGRDGWGRAFCKGLEIAVEEGFTYVTHIEGDSLLRLPVAKLIDQMVEAQRECCTTAVAGMKKDMPGWVETGLMIFKTAYIKESNFIQKYSWPVRRVSPTPERVISDIIKDDVFMLPIKAVRGDKQQITHENVLSLNLDWVTHCHNDVWATDRFFEAAIAGKGAVSPVISPVTILDNPIQTVTPSPVQSQGLLLNLGCGTNKLPDWVNHDADVDVTKTLPWADNSAYYVFIEHCLEHVSYHQAIGFMEEAFRVLAPGGVLRVVVPSIEQIANTADQAYFDFAKKFGGDGTKKGALKAILFSHGHQQAWTASLMTHSLRYAGFEAIEQCQVGMSRHSALRGVEGHGKVIGNQFNTIESMCFEATKQPHQKTHTIASNGARVALVVGGSEKVKSELAEAEALCAAAGCDVTRFVINDMIPQAEGPCIVVSLHPTKLADWLKRRGENGHPTPSQVWAHRGGPNVTHHVEDWAGSSGLFAVKIARQLGFERIILCGVPMDPSAKHVIRGQPWPAGLTFRRGWERHKDEIKPFVRSMSGWTAGLFGRPSGTELATQSG